MPIREALPQHHDAKAGTLDGITLYHTLVFDESDSIELAQKAWQIHAEGYYSMGFVKATAIDEGGFLSPGIDKARGPNVQYYLTLNSDSDLPNDCATLRKISIPDGKDFRSLPAFIACEETIGTDAVTLLEGIDTQSRHLVEISALAGSANALPTTVYETLRTALHDGIRGEEIWLFSLVASTYHKLVRSMGKDVFVVLGNDTPIDDDRVSDTVRLKPLILDTISFFETLLASLKSEEDPSQRLRYARSLSFFAEGLPEEYLSDEVKQAIEQIRLMMVS